MSQSEKNEKWIAYKPVHSICMNYSAIQFNHFEFIIASGHLGADGKEGVQKYNLHSNEWDEIIRFTDDLFVTLDYDCILDPSIVSISKTHKLYLMNNYQNCEQPKMFIVDMQTNQLSTRKAITNAVHSACVNVNGIIHVIGGSDNSKHLTWNPDNDETKEIYDFAPDILELQYGRSIYVPSKDVTLLIGARCGKNLERHLGIWRFHVKLNKWESMINGTDWEYSNVSAVLSSNENYVIIACGYRQQFPDGKIYVLDIRNEKKYELNECGIRSPERRLSNIVMTGGIKDEYLAVGWTKELFKTLEFKELALPPMYIMQLITKWYNEEEVHWIRMVDSNDNDDDSHFAIELRHIISSLTK